MVVPLAAVHDRDGAALVLRQDTRCFPWLELVWADVATTPSRSRRPVAKVPILRLEIVKRTDGSKDFVVLPRRWVIKRTLSGLAAIAVWPRISRTWPRRCQPLSPSLQSDGKVSGTRWCRAVEVAAQLAIRPAGQLSDPADNLIPLVSAAHPWAHDEAKAIDRGGGDVPPIVEIGRSALPALSL